MASNSFGTQFKITTWGESHGKAVGVVIDGCPAGIALSDVDISLALERRAPGKNPYTSPRKELDIAEIYSGIFEGKTTGAPISIVILNKDSDSSKYEPIKNLLRPGHANYSYTKKYGCFDYRGGGRSSARETACRVAAGAVAQAILDHNDIQIYAYIKSIGQTETAEINFDDLSQLIEQSPIFCPDPNAAKEMTQVIEEAKAAGDSLGGIVEFLIHPIPVGLGDPIYEKLEAKLAQAMMSLPASKGVEIGEGFKATCMLGSQHNDPFIQDREQITSSNHAGGILGGISTGMPIIGRVAFKPTSSIMKEQDTVDYQGQKQKFNLPKGSRHDPCVAIRAVPVVSAMCAIVIVDALLMNRCARLEPYNE